MPPRRTGGTADRPCRSGPRMSTSREVFSREVNRHAGRRRQGAFANPVAADALDPVAIDRPGAGADHGAGDRPAAAAELVCDYGEVWAEALLGPGFHTPLNILAWIVSIAAGLGVVFGAVFLMPAITSLVASVFVDDVADHVEREHYPAERPGAALPFGLAITEGIKTALLTILVYLIALPFVFVRRRRLHRLLRRHRLAARPGIFRARGDAVSHAGGSQGDAQATMPRPCSPPGLIIAAFVSIPIVNLATPMFGMAFMVHMHKRLSGPRPELIEPARQMR